MRMQDFSKFRDVALVGVQRASLLLPAFTLDIPTWAGASIILAEYPIGNANWFSIKENIEEFGSNFVPAVRYSEDDYVIRYKFWEDVEEVLYYPVYNGEKLGPSAVLEIWSVNTEEAPTLAENQVLETSVLLFPPNQTCNACCENPSQQTLLVATEPTIIDPGAYCNPFCTPLLVP